MKKILIFLLAFISLNTYAQVVKQIPYTPEFKVNAIIEDTLFISGDTIAELSHDPTLVDSSRTTIVSEAAIKAYVDNKTELGGLSGNIQINKNGEFYGTDSLNWSDKLFIENETEIKSTNFLGTESSFQVKNSNDDLLFDIKDDGLASFSNDVDFGGNGIFESTNPSILISDDIGSSARTYEIEYDATAIALRMFRRSGGSALSLTFGSVVIGKKIGGIATDALRIASPSSGENCGVTFLDNTDISRFSLFPYNTSSVNGYIDNENYFELFSGGMHFGREISNIWEDWLIIDGTSKTVTMPFGAKYPEQFQIQFASTAINPAGGGSAATVVDYGITSALEYSNGVTDISAVNIRFPSSENYSSNVDTTKQLFVRIGYAASTNTGDVRWGVKYLYIKDDDAANATEDGEIFVNSTVSTTTDGLVPVSFNLPPPDSDDVAVLLRISRYGGDAADTNGGNANLLGVSLVGTTIE